jgi:hypothetical protein
MKLLDIINENEEEKLLKKARIIYKAFKIGTVNYYLNGEENEPARMTYTLSDERNIFISEEGGIWITPKKIKVREENKECLKISPGRVQDLIKEKFGRFNIKINLRNFNPREEWDTWLDREGLNEQDDVINEDAEVDVPKEKKRVKTIFRALRSGVMFVPFLGYKIKYELNNDYQLSIGIGKGHNNCDTIMFIPSDDKTPKIKLYEIGSDGVERYFEVNGYDAIYQAMWTKISEKFKHFGIHLR